MDFKEESKTKGIIYDIKPALKNGLEELGYTIEELQQNWIYCGSNGGPTQRHGGIISAHPGRLEYWKQHCRYRGDDDTLPDWEPECHCGQRLITENAYLTTKKPDEDGEYDYIVIGSCCIKTFMPDGLSKICEDCEEPHKNRKDNKCNDCRLHHKKGKKCPGLGNPKYGGTRRCKNECGTYTHRETGEIKYYKRCYECTKASKESWQRYQARNSY
tara:strand:+ start:527 stop:1171 length:645 start_codon:yes stop_codon:yes gene_type:complete